MSEVKMIGYCGKLTTMGHGDYAVCGEEYWKEIYTCDKCKIKKQAADIKLLREALLQIAIETDNGTSEPFEINQIANEALAATNPDKE